MGSEHPGDSRSRDDRQDSESSGEDSDWSKSRDSRDSLSEWDRQADRVPGTDSPVSINELFDLLSQPGNRYTLAYLVRADGAVPYDDLVEYVVDKGGIPEGLSTEEFRDRVATRLVHSNLPKLDESGLVDYDPQQQTIRRTDATSVAVPYLELALTQFSTE
ncbi:hypothetical protein BRD06_05025 [Halobacteriales archaeon QS_9_67_15]|nr:MAG: hypothetical protein BRD06_05025 [Halobacteriales archaeon QS_9_67_15]